MNDVISRQAAIDTVNKNRDTVFHDSVHYEDVVYDISNLPSTQPDVPDTNVGDMISRQAAIDLFPNDALECDTKGGYIAPHLARRMIEELPSAQPDYERSEK